MTTDTTNPQRGHISLQWLYWVAALAGGLMTTGGFALLIFAVKGLK